MKSPTQSSTAKISTDDTVKFQFNSIKPTKEEEQLLMLCISFNDEELVDLNDIESSLTQIKLIEQVKIPFNSNPKSVTKMAEKPVINQKSQNIINKFRSQVSSSVTINLINNTSSSTIERSNSKTG